MLACTAASSNDHRATPALQTQPHAGIPWVDILGVHVHVVTMAEAMRSAEAMTESNQAHQLVTVNPEFIMAAQDNKEFRKVLNSAALSFADGIGVVWASRILGQPIRERVPGVEMFENLVSIAAAKSLRVFLLGAAEGIAEQASRVLQQKHSGLIVAGTFSGTPKPEDDASICQMIQRAKTDLLFVAFGAPNQDLWIARNQPRLRIPVAMGVGGTFDFVVGKARRAPKALRVVGLEWLHRLIREPWRWKRQLALPRFVVAIFLQRLREGSFAD